ncbi:MAG: hypothetical protein LBT05_16470 [Planctomycetaceae bacterium]|jgi:hypothetical protein|nr:hypothetical protein [Planctomycetaceae bacterium]
MYRIRKIFLTVQFYFAFLLGLVPAWGAEKTPIEHLSADLSQIAETCEDIIDESREQNSTLKKSKILKLPQNLHRKFDECNIHSQGYLERPHLFLKSSFSPMDSGEYFL